MCKSFFALSFLPASVSQDDIFILQVIPHLQLLFSVTRESLNLLYITLARTAELNRRYIYPTYSSHTPHKALSNTYTTPAPSATRVYITLPPLIPSFLLSYARSLEAGCLSEVPSETLQQFCLDNSALFDCLFFQKAFSSLAWGDPELIIYVSTVIAVPLFFSLPSMFGINIHFLALCSNLTFMCVPVFICTFFGTFNRLLLWKTSESDKIRKSDWCLSDLGEFATMMLGYCGWLLGNYRVARVFWPRKQYNTMYIFSSFYHSSGENMNSWISNSTSLCYTVWGIMYAAVLFLVWLILQ